MKTLITLILCITAVSAFATDEKGLDRVVTQYLAVHAALASDNLGDAKLVALELSTFAKHTDQSDMADAVKKVWNAESEKLYNAARGVGASKTIDEARSAFLDVSNIMIKVAKVAKPSGVMEFYCPMAFNNKGAGWLQRIQAVRNPYYGSQMLSCGHQVKDM